LKIPGILRRLAISKINTNKSNIGDEIHKKWAKINTNKSILGMKFTRNGQKSI
jgi:hypothetical protein